MRNIEWNVLDLNHRKENSMDKVHKIREEVERMHNLLPIMDGDNISVNYADRICTTLEMYIDSLQEEPVSIWHDGCENPKSETNVLMIRKGEEDSNYPPIAGCFHSTNFRLDGKNWGYYNGFCYNEIAPPVKWAYIDDILNFSNVERTVKEWKEEPVSEKKCLFTKDNYTDEDRNVLCEDCDERCEYAKKEKPSIPEIVDEHYLEMLGEEPVSDDEIEKSFSAGDVVVYVSRHPAYSGLYLLGNPNDLSIGYSCANKPYQIYLRNCTIASEDERKQFMRELNLNGYKWNENTLRIEKIEEPVSEELEEAAREFIEPYREISECGIDYNIHPARVFKAGANWQKEKDNRSIMDKLNQIRDKQLVFPENDFSIDDFISD